MARCVIARLLGHCIPESEHLLVELAGPLQIVNLQRQVHYAIHLCLLDIGSCSQAPIVNSKARPASDNRTGAYAILYFANSDVREDKLMQIFRGLPKKAERKLCAAVPDALNALRLPLCFCCTSGRAGRPGASKADFPAMAEPGMVFGEVPCLPLRRHSGLLLVQQCRYGTLPVVADAPSSNVSDNLAIRSPGGFHIRFGFLCEKPLYLNNRLVIEKCKMQISLTFMHGMHKTGRIRQFRRKLVMNWIWALAFKFT
jgi:hypothetical protein